LTATDTPDPVQPGGTISYGLTMQNAGPNIALDAVLSNPLPAGTTFVAITAPEGWTCSTPSVGSSGTVSCTTPCFPPGSAVFTLQVKANNCLANGTVLNNSATPSSKTLGAATVGAQSTLVTCDDNNACTVDTCAPAGGCLYSPVPVPAEASGVQISREQPQTAVIIWAAAGDATSYDVLRGRTGSLPVGSSPGTELCVGSALAIPTMSDLEALAPGTGFWYVVRSRNSCGNGSYGAQGNHGTPTIERTSATCP